MGDPSRPSEPEEDAGVEADRGAAGGTGRRPSMLGGILAIAIAIALVVLIVLLHLTGTIGPGAH
jgi:hypothetical protein